MKKSIILIVSLLVMAGGLSAQKVFTRNGKVSFHSETPMETIEADNQQVISLIDTKEGTMAFSLLMKGFQFEKALMQEHFNEKYVESDKYPKAKFEGKITNLDVIDFSKDGTYPAQVMGKMTMHGVTQEVSTEGEIKIEKGKVYATADFTVLLEDYKIQVPNVVKDNIAKSIDIKVDMAYEPYKK
jgi:hypothetical protein